MLNMKKEKEKKAHPTYSSGRSNEPALGPLENQAIALAPQLGSILMEKWPLQPSAQRKSRSGHIGEPLQLYYPVD